MNTFNWIQFAVALAAQILPMIAQAEQAIGKGKGATKAALVLNTSAAAAQIAGATLQQIGELKANLPPVIDQTVETLNQAGALPKSTTP